MAQTMSPRRFGAINALGLWTLYIKEVRRFLKVVVQTVLAPVLSTLLFMTVFMLAFGANRGAIGDVTYMQFLAPGLIMMGVVNNAFANSSSSIMVSKVQGTMVDFLMPPLTSAELTLAFIGGAVTRGLMVGLATLIAMQPFVGFAIAHVWAIVFYAVSAALALSTIGILGGLWAEKFDHLSAVTNFVLMPLIFLSGTFYSVNVLPEPFRTMTTANPVFYMIDGLRYAFTGHADGSIAIGVVLLVGLNAVLLAIAYAALRSGWRIKS